MRLIVLLPPSLHEAQRILNMLDRIGIGIGNPARPAAALVSGFRRRDGEAVACEAIIEKPTRLPSLLLHGGRARSSVDGSDFPMDGAPSEGCSTTTILGLARRLIMCHIKK